MIGLLTLLSIGLVVGLLALTAYTAWMLTHPPRRTYASALARGKPGDPGELPPGPRGVRPWKAWTLKHDGLDLPVWEIEGDDAAGPVFILSHGWGDSRIGALTRAVHLLPMASRVVMWDMPGHGEAPGVCSLGVREAAALATLVERVGTERAVVLYGWSLGAGVGIECAAGMAVTAPQLQAVSPPPCPRSHLGGGVVAEAPYRLAMTPARNVLESWALPWRVNLPLALGLLGLRLGVGWSWRGFDRAGHAARLRVPLLVIHGEADDISPIADGREIAAATPHATIVELAAGHHSIWTDETTAPKAAAAVRAWLATIGHERQSDG